MHSTFVSAFLELFVVDGLLDEVEDGHRELRVRQRVSLGVGCGSLQRRNTHRLLIGLRSELLAALPCPWRVLLAVSLERM